MRTAGDKVHLLIATDFDGTIAPIRTDPREVRIDPEARELLAEATTVSGVEVAFISGRDLEDLSQRTEGVPAWRSGSHGQEIADRDGDLVRSAEPWRGELNEIWLAAARELGLRIEPKKFGVAVHWRGVAGVGERHPVIEAFRRWAEQKNLHLTEGRCVAEASVAGASKEEVLRVLKEMTSAERIVYAGDDLTDFPALGWAARHGRGFFLRSPERNEPPPAAVEEVGSREALIQHFRDELNRLRGDDP